MTLGVEDQEALAALEFRLRTVLPEEYQDCYEEVQPVSMGSAGLKYGSDGKVAWNEMWATFCDLAMAGGPPHKGMLLEPGTQAEIDANSGRYEQVVDEIVRGVRLVTGLAARASGVPGWVRVDCHSDAMAGWLLRAIVMENVSARCEGSALDLPAGPALPGGERNQERRHRHRQDLPLLDRTHVAGPEARNRRALREDGGLRRRSSSPRWQAPTAPTDTRRCQPGWPGAFTRTPGSPDRVIATLAGSVWTARALAPPSG